MKVTEAMALPLDMIEKIYQNLPFISEVLEKVPEELAFFQKSSKILEVEPDEVIIRRGEFENWIYFLLIGQLLVYPEYQDKKKHVVAFISPGEMFGELAFIRELDRNATIVADQNSRRNVLLGINVEDFGLIDDFSNVSIQTKIIFYRFAVKTIRKRLEALSIEYPENDLALKSPAYKQFEGENNSVRELLYLHDQSKVYARYLHKWNRSLEIDTNYHSATGVISMDHVEELLK